MVHRKRYSQPSFIEKNFGRLAALVITAAIGVIGWGYTSDRVERVNETFDSYTYASANPDSDKIYVGGEQHTMMQPLPRDSVINKLNSGETYGFLREVPEIPWIWDSRIDSISTPYAPEELGSK